MTQRTQRVREMATLYNGFPFASSRFSANESLPLVRIRDITADAFETFIPERDAPDSSLLRNGDVVVGMDGDFNVRLWNRGVAALNQRVCALRASDDCDSRFLAYALPSHLKIINDLTYATTVKHLSSWQVEHISLVSPGLCEQRAIADYLDEQTARIDALIAKQNQLIDTLRERRVLARETLARHVNDGQRLKWSLVEMDVRAGEAAEKLPLMSVSIDWGVRRRDSVTNDEARAEDLSNYKVCASGDIVINRMRAFQGALGVALEAGLVSPDYAVLRTNTAYQPAWLANVMRTKVFVSEMVTRIRGIGGTESGSVRTPRINTRDLLDIRVAEASIETQSDEQTRVDTQTAKIDALIAKTQEHIALAKERRAALITAAVTGQFDVRTAAQKVGA